MSINMCPYCGEHFDEDFNVEHIENCEAERKEEEEECTVQDVKEK